MRFPEEETAQISLLLSNRAVPPPLDRMMHGLGLGRYALQHSPGTVAVSLRCSGAAVSQCARFANRSVVAMHRHHERALLFWLSGAEHVFKSRRVALRVDKWLEERANWVTDIN